MRRTYEVAARTDKRAIRERLKQEGQLLLPMVEFVERAELAIDEVIGVMGRATIEAVLEPSVATRFLRSPNSRKRGSSPVCVRAA